MLKDIIPGNILFLDIETVPVAPRLEELSEPMQILWGKKSNFLSQSTETSPADLWPRAGIYAEFGKIICIATACLNQDKLRVKCFSGHDEKQLLEEFAALLRTYYNRDHHLLCAHNGKEFDFPFLARRMIVNGIPLPGILDTAGQKPWQIRHLDTMELWKFGDYKSYTSVELLAALFDIPTPKDDICGADVCKVYWEEENLERIAEYCRKDVVTIVQILLRYMGQATIPASHIEFV
jgi:DNA polymerase elongation subunit (family B)